MKTSRVKIIECQLEKKIKAYFEILLNELAQRFEETQSKMNKTLALQQLCKDLSSTMGRIDNQDWHCIVGKSFSFGAKYQKGSVIKATVNVSNSRKQKGNKFVVIMYKSPYYEIPTPHIAAEKPNLENKVEAKLSIKQCKGLTEEEKSELLTMIKSIMAIKEPNSETFASSLRYSLTLWPQKGHFWHVVSGNFQSYYNEENVPRQCLIEYKKDKILIFQHRGIKTKGFFTQNSHYLEIFYYIFLFVGLLSFLYKFTRCATNDQRFICLYADVVIYPALVILCARNFKSFQSFYARRASNKAARKE